MFIFVFFFFKQKSAYELRISDWISDVCSSVLETIASASAAAAAGGVTTMVCLPNTDPVIDDVPMVEFVARRAQETDKVRLFCYGAITRGLNGRELAEMGLLAEAGALAFTDGAKALADATVMPRALSFSRGPGLLIVPHPDEPTRRGEGGVDGGPDAARLGLR